MTQNRQRQPRGIPTGGEFAANAHDEANVSLPDTSAMRAAAKVANDDLDAIWVERNRARSAGKILIGEREQWEREESARRNLRDLASSGGDFEPYTFSTPKPEYGEEFHGLPDEEDYDHEWASNRRGARAYDFMLDPTEEVEQDIQDGIESGSLSPLFDYTVEREMPENHYDAPTLRVNMALKPYTDQHLYLNVHRARTGTKPEYSDRVRGTVTKLRERLASYQYSTGSRFEEPEDDHLNIEVKTSLRDLGD